PHVRHGENAQAAARRSEAAPCLRGSCRHGANCDRGIVRCHRRTDYYYCTCRDLPADMRAWIDIENPPQVQYLSPFKGALEARGHEVVVTARDQGVTLDLLQARGIDARVVGGESGGSTGRKVANLLRRVVALSRLFRGRERPSLLVAASRSSDLAARSIG